MQPEAVLLNPSLSDLRSPLRIAEHSGRGVLMYSFTSQYRAWVHVVYIDRHTRSPMVMARVILRRAYVELGLSLPESEARAQTAQRRRRAWMTIDGDRRLGVGADGPDYRSVAVALDSEMIVAVVPMGQGEVAVRLVGSSKHS